MCALNHIFCALDSICFKHQTKSFWAPNSILMGTKNIFDAQKVPNSEFLKSGHKRLSENIDKTRKIQTIRLKNKWVGHKN